MGRVVLDFDEDVTERLRDRALRAGFPDEAVYINSLVARDLDDDVPNVDDEAFPAGPPHLTIRNKAELEQLLLNRLEDTRPSIEATPAFWADLRLEMERRAAERARP